MSSNLYKYAYKPAWKRGGSHLGGLAAFSWKKNWKKEERLGYCVVNQMEAEDEHNPSNASLMTKTQLW